MKPKEKAKELIEKFKDKVNPYVGSGMLSNSHDDDQIIYQSKKCALICVDQIILTHPPLSGAHTYWLEVKKRN